MMKAPGAFLRLLWGRVMDQFPKLRWRRSSRPAPAGVALRSCGRRSAPMGTGAFRSFRDWRSQTIEVLAGRNFHHRLPDRRRHPLLVDLLGPDVLIFGTDYGHLGPRVARPRRNARDIAQLGNSIPSLPARSSTTNARNAVRHHPSFTPAPPADRYSTSRTRS